MAEKSTKDSVMEKIDVLVEPFKVREDAFTMQDVAKRYHFTQARAYKLIARLIADGLVAKVGHHHYILTSLGESGGRKERGAGPELPQRRPR